MHEISEKKHAKGGFPQILCELVYVYSSTYTSGNCSKCVFVSNLANEVLGPLRLASAWHVSGILENKLDAIKNNTPSLQLAKISSFH